jgi:hypothetical protein
VECSLVGVGQIVADAAVAFPVVPALKQAVVVAFQVVAGETMPLKKPSLAQSSAIQSPPNQSLQIADFSVAADSVIADGGQGDGYQQLHGSLLWSSPMRPSLIWSSMI